ncbi:MAG: toll/interleukin-1 receptor domain-containing protein [Thermoplasmata archaeon]
MAYRVFLAHSTQDGKLVGSIYEALRERDIECFVAEKHREPGKFITEKIEEAILSSDAVLVLWTEHGAASPFVNQEVGFARRSKKRIIPFVQAGVKLEGFLYGMDSREFDGDTIPVELETLVSYIEGLRDDKQREEAFFPEETEPKVPVEVVEHEEEPMLTILELSDVSHALAKRYSADILIQGPYSRDNARKVVRTATDYVRKQNYYRNPKVREYWGEQAAHVVWLFLYRSLDDIGPVNWVCRSLWLDPDLEPEAQPGKLGYDEQLDDILLDWNENYQTFRRFYREHTADKASYLSSVDDILAEATPIIESARDLLKSHKEDSLDEEELIHEMRDLGERFRPLYLAAGELGFAPHECSELDEVFQSMMADGDNIFIHFSPEGLETWDKKARLYLADTSLRRALDELYQAKGIRERLR